MSVAVEALSYLGPNLAVLALFAYELFWPRWLHPTGGTRLQKLLHEPNPAVAATLEAIADELDAVDDEKVRDWFNGDQPRPSDVKLDSEEIKRGL